MRKNFLFLLLLTGSVLLEAQPTELITRQELLGQQLGKVESAKSTFSQQWDFDMDVPYRVHLTIVETDKKKGKTETMEYRFNLADLDENLVREDTKRDLKYVTAGVGGKQNMVEVMKDGEQQNYDSEVSLLVSNSQEADDLREMLRTVIPLAKELDKQRLKINSYDEMISWLNEHITDYSIAGSSFGAALKVHDEDALIYDYTFTESGRKEPTTTVYTYNMADLDPYDVKLDIRGKAITVKTGTERDQRFITIRENGEMKNYDDEISFQMGDVESARDLSEVLRLVIPEAKERRSKMLVPAPDLAAALDAFQAGLTNFEQGGDKFEQQLENGCFTTYRLQETNSKSESTENSYEFHLGDLTANNLAIKVSGKDLFVVGDIKNGDNFVKVFRDGEQRNYDDEVEFRAAGVENAKTLAFLLKQVVEGCDEQQQRLMALSRKGTLSDWLVEQVDSYKDPHEADYEQHITIDEANCSLVFNTITPKGKGVEKIRYEVFLKELNKDALAPHVSGKTMSVELKTIHDQDHVKSYKDDEVEKYTDSFEIRVPGIVEARSLITGLKELLEGCKE
ncbi:MAG: hypothetical protein R2824_10080 [Saprospiraceae bacterium]